MLLGPDQLDHLALLSRLALSDDEKRLFRDQLGRIVEAVEALELFFDERDGDVGFKFEAARAALCVALGQGAGSAAVDRGDYRDRGLEWVEDLLDILPPRVDRVIAAQLMADDVFRAGLIRRDLRRDHHHSQWFCQVLVLEHPDADDNSQEQDSRHDRGNDPAWARRASVASRCR